MFIKEAEKNQMIEYGDPQTYQWLLFLKNEMKAFSIIVSKLLGSGAKEAKFMVPYSNITISILFFKIQAF